MTEPAKFLLARGRRIAFPRRPLIMGILNLNDDSFSGDGTLDIDIALARSQEMIALGADIIDVGGESARTNRAAVAIEEEIARVVPYVERFSEMVATSKPRDARQVFPPLLSINTWRPEVGEKILAVGGDILNDMSALPDLQNAHIAARHGAALLIMHSIGQPKVAHTHVGYANVMETLNAFFLTKIAEAKSAGLIDEQLILDPGIDFAKQREDNLTIYRHFAQIADLGYITLLPVSRKTVIGDVLGGIPARERDAGTVACIVAGAERGASMFRVHEVNAAYETLAVLEEIGRI